MQYLHDIYNSVLLKDVIARNRIRDTALLESIVLYLMDNIGNTFSAKTISDFLKSQGRKLSTETVYNYLKALESAFLIHKVVRFDIKGKRILETQEKYYLSDLGLRHAVIGYRDNDIAGVLENTVFLELLRRGFSVNIGKQDVAEVDFVANRLTTGSISKSAIFLRRKTRIGNLRRWRQSRITTKSLFCPRIRCCGSIVEGSVKRTLLTFCWNTKYEITQEREKDGTAEAEPPFFTKIIAVGSSAPKHNHQDLYIGDPTDRCHSENLHPKAVRPASCIRLAHGGSP